MKTEKSEKFYGDPRYYQLLQKMKETYSIKNHDYASNKDPMSNFKECEEIGVDAFRGVLVRMSDKWSRIRQLTSKGTNLVKDESIEDTLKDLAVYALIAILLHRDRR